jgi:hypothetical protein
MATNEQIEALYRANGWNKDRLRRSFASKQGLLLLEEQYGEGVAFDIDFEQIHAKAYGFDVLIRVRLAADLSKFEAFLYLADKCRPLHRPVQIPIVYGFTAQANQLQTAVSGLQYVYNVAGVECLDYYPDGMREG